MPSVAHFLCCLCACGHVGVCACVQPLVLGVIDVAYGFKSGFNEAIEASGHLLGDAKLADERTLLRGLFNEVLCCGCVVGCGV